MSREPVALITGAARRIGAQIAREVHARGCTVVIHYHGSSADAENLAASLNDLRPDSATIVQADLVEPDGPEVLAKEVLQRHSRLALLVNNASRFYPTPQGTVTHDQWKDLMGSNVRGPFFLCQALQEALSGGAIVNVLDIHARKPMAGHPVYSMAKAALEMMTYALAREMAPDTRVNGVAPGAILWPEAETQSGEKEDILSRIALQRLGDPADIASAVAYLGLDAAYVTGQVLAVDGGRSLEM